MNILYRSEIGFWHCWSQNTDEEDERTEDKLEIERYNWMAIRLNGILSWEK